MSKYYTTYYTSHKEDGHMVAGQWFDSPCYRITLHQVDQFGHHESKVLRRWPQTEADAVQVIKDMLYSDMQSAQLYAERKLINA